MLLFEYTYKNNLLHEHKLFYLYNILIINICLSKKVIRD